MTIEEFDKTGFRSGDRAQYKDGRVYPIASVDFDEKLVGLLMEISGAEPNEISWVRCENIATACNSYYPDQETISKLTERVKELEDGYLNVLPTKDDLEDEKDIRGFFQQIRQDDGTPVWDEHSLYNRTMGWDECFQWLHKRFKEKARALLTKNNNDGE